MLTTSDTNFAIAAYEYEAIVDYLVKPITQERFEKSIQKVKNSLAQQPRIASNKPNSLVGDELYINIDRRLIKLKFDEILLTIEFKNFKNTKKHRGHPNQPNCCY